MESGRLRTEWRYELDQEYSDTVGNNQDVVKKDLGIYDSMVNALEVALIWACLSLLPAPLSEWRTVKGVQAEGGGAEAGAENGGE
nr:hypothetical protein CFP56_63566 [Quercus suber]